jgi:hypothetical protein
MYLLVADSGLRRVIPVSDSGSVSWTALTVTVTTHTRHWRTRRRADPSLSLISFIILREAPGGVHLSIQYSDDDSPQIPKFSTSPNPTPKQKPPNSATSPTKPIYHSFQPFRHTLQIPNLDYKLVVGVMPGIFGYTVRLCWGALYALW